MTPKATNQRPARRRGIQIGAWTLGAVSAVLTLVVGLGPTGDDRVPLALMFGLQALAGFLAGWHVGRLRRLELPADRWRRATQGVFGWILAWLLLLVFLVIAVLSGRGTGTPNPFLVAAITLIYVSSLVSGVKDTWVNLPDELTPSEPATLPSGSVRQLRLVVAAADYDDALRFYRDALGMPERESYQAEGGALVSILDAGRATLELANPAQVAHIDQVEVGRPASRGIRLALEVSDTAATTVVAVAAGADLVAPPTRTPWNSLNARLEGPAGLQLTLFEELGDPGPG